MLAAKVFQLLVLRKRVGNWLCASNELGPDGLSDQPYSVAALDELDSYTGRLSSEHVDRVRNVVSPPSSCLDVVNRHEVDGSLEWLEAARMSSMRFGHFGSL